MKKIAKQKKLDGQDGQDGPDPAGPGDGLKNPLASLEGREWLARELAVAEDAEAYGPGGSGWMHNESLRAGIVERAEFLRALVGLLEA